MLDSGYPTRFNLPVLWFGCIGPHPESSRMVEAVGYIRRSSSEESPISEEAQRATIARLAADHRDRDGNPAPLDVVHVYRDWGRSGGDEQRQRYLEMLERLEGNGIAAVIAYDQDRLARSNWMFSGLLRLADTHGFAILTPAGNLADDSRRDYAEMRGVMDGAELRKIRRRNGAIARHRSERGDDNGVPPFGYTRVKVTAPTMSLGHAAYSTWARGKRTDHPARLPRMVEPGGFVFVKTDHAAIAHVIEVYQREGSYLATSRALNVEKFPTKQGRTWHPVVVREIVMRERPDLISGVERGTRGPGKPRILRGLLTCHCGHRMTPGLMMGKPTYYCSHGQRGLHPRPRTIEEEAILPWIMEEADRLLLPHEIVSRNVEADPVKVEAVQRLQASIDSLQGTASEATLAALRAERDALIETPSEEIPALPGRIDWSWSPDVINTLLRSMWTTVILDERLRPVRVEWKREGWRRPDAA